MLSVYLTSSGSGSQIFDEWIARGLLGKRPF